MSVLTFNTWLLKAAKINLTKNYRQRLKNLPKYLANTGAGVINLQEVWSDSDKREICVKLKELNYQTCQFTTSLIGIGDGLMTISKFPMVKFDKSLPFSASTTTLESFSSKRAIKTTLSVPGIGDVDIYNTHLGAVDLNSEIDKFYPGQVEKQLVQLVEFTTWLKATQTSEKFIVAGDFNFHYQEYAGKGVYGPEVSKHYKYLINNSCKRGDLKDSFMATNSISTSEPACETTYDHENPYVYTGRYKNLPSSTVDYILSCEFGPLKPVSSNIVLNQPLDLKDVEDLSFKKRPQRLSDHYGVLTTYSWQDR